MSVTEILTHVSDAKRRLIQQYKDKPRINSILQAFIEQIQEIETMGKQLNDERSIFTAIGVQLDLVGTIVGLTRLGGESNSDYRVRLHARVSLNVSQGEPERLISTFKLLLGADLVIFQELPPAEVSLSSEVTFADQDEVDAALAILESVAPAGVRVQYIGIFDATEPFAMAGALSGLGFGTTADALAGGKFATLVQRNSFFSFDGDSENKNEGFGTIEDTLVGGQFDTL